MVKSFFLLFLLFVNYIFADSAVTKIYAHYEDAKPSNFFAKNSIYYWGTDKNLVIDGFEYNGHKYDYVSEATEVKIRRSDNINASGTPCGLFAEKNGNKKHLKATFPEDCDMAKVMAGRVINIGALDLFKNTGYTAKNIERVDFISPNGIVAPSNFLDLEKAGHVVTEKSGNNEIKIAAILSLDENGDPASYGPLVDIHGDGTKDYSLVNIYLPDNSTIYKQYFGFYINEKNSPQGHPWYITSSHEPLGMCFVTLKDLGIAPGQKYYGFSYFGRDVTNNMNLVDYNSFPKDTGGDTADPYGGVASYFTDEDLSKAFTCDIGTILFNTKRHQSTTNFYTVDLATGNHKTIEENFYNHPINAIGYNVIDNYIWGFDLSAKKVVRVDKDRNVKTYNIKNLPDNKYYIGDVSKNGVLFLANNSGKVYKVDVNPKSSTYLKYLGSIDLTVPDIKVGDFAFNPTDGYIYTINEGRISTAPKNTDVYKIDPQTGKTVDIGPSGLPFDKVDFHSYLFDKNGDLYVYGKQNIVYKVSLSKGETKAVEFTTVDFDSIGGDGARCPNTEVTKPTDTEGICYAVSDVKKKLYKVYLDPGANPLPRAQKVDIIGTDDSINSEGSAYYSATGLVYAFHEGDNGPKQYSIDPNTGKATYIKTYTTMKSNVVGASFYGGYFYVIAKNGDGDAVLYKIQPDDWTIISSISVNGDTSDADSLAINGNGQAYITLDNKKRLYSIDINTAKTVYKLNISTKSEPEALSFAKDGNLYVEDSEDGTTNDTDQIFQIDLTTGKLIAAAQIPPEDDIDIEGLSCNVEVPDKPIENEDICYVVDNKRNELYKIDVQTGSTPLPEAIKIDLTNIKEDLDGQATAYDADTGLVYAFAEEDKKNLYSIDPESGEVKYIKHFPELKKGIVAASFYGDYLYVIAKTQIDDATLYKIKKSDWSLISQQDLSGDTTDADALAINEDGEAYMFIDEGYENPQYKDLYKIDLDSAKTTLYKKHIYVHTDTEGLSFSKSGKLYLENSDYDSSMDTDKIYELDLETGDLTEAGQIPHSDDAAVAGLACNIKSKVSVCEEGENLIKNGSFPEGSNTPDWNGVFWTGTNPNYDTPDGMPYVYVDGDSSGKDGYQDVPIEVGKAYKLSFYGAYKDLYEDQKVSLIYLDINKEPIGVSNSVEVTHNILNDNKLVPYTLNIIQAPENAKYLRVEFSTENGRYLKVDGFDLRVDCDLQRGISITDSQLGEEDAATGAKMKFVIATNLPAPEGGMDIKYKVVSKTATANSDFLANPDTTYIAHINEGEQSVDVLIPVVDDSKKEDAEYFEVQLEDYDGAKMVDPTAIGVIIDNDDNMAHSGNDGFFIINDKGYSDGKLRTKIAGSSPVVVIKAQEGFEIVHNRVKSTYTNCVNSCVCDPCGVPICTQTCASNVSFKDENSSTMYIDKVVLYYQDGSTYELLGSKTLESGDSLEITLPTNKVTKNAYIKVFGHSDTEYATGKSKDLTSISDHFAIRPDRFDIELASKTLTNPLKAQENVTMTVKAVDIHGLTTEGYSGNDFNETLTDAKYDGDQLSYGLNITDQSFLNGYISKVTSYNEAGELTIKIEEKEPYFAEIDKDDNPLTYKITPGSYSVRVIPDHFDVTYNVQDANAVDKITFFSNTPTTMGSKLSYSIVAKGKLGAITTRYTSDKYADDVNITVEQSITTDTARSLILNYNNTKGNGEKTFFSTSGVNLDLFLNESDFTDGNSSDLVDENFVRDHTKAENPLILNISKISVVEEHGVGSIKVDGYKNDINQKAYFYYGRAHAPSPQTTDTPDLDAKVYYEVYCKGCNKSVFLQAAGKSSIDSVYWYILPSATVSDFGSTICNYTNPRAIDTTTISDIDHINFDTIKVVASKIPSKNKIYYTPIQTYLQYHKFGTALPEHYFNISFSSKSTVWAGEGDTGSTVDTNISKKENKSLDW